MPTISNHDRIQSSLSDAEALHADVPALRFERRMAERFETIGQVEAVRMCPTSRAPDASTHVEPKIDLSLLDESITGAGFRSASPMAPGTVLEVRIGPATAPWKTGRVVRCVAMGKCFRVGVEYGRRLAA